MGAVMKSLTIVSLLLVVSIGLAAVTQSSRNQGATAADSATHQHKSAEKLPEKRSGAVTVGQVQIEIPDLLVKDQDGIERRFYSDLIKDKVVILSFFFTSCPSFCPRMNLRLKKLQNILAERLGKDVFFVTVTKDPETDTVPRLKDWGKKLDIKSGWTMITGDTKNIGKIVHDFTGDPLGPDMHNTIFIIGNDKTGEWADLSGMATLDELRQQIDAVTTR
jgi:cytochrome oxidase Cu insertion factor (SCO1/SenC/PrrC family)